MRDLRDLTICWQRGWSVARALPDPAAAGGGLWVRCLQPGRDVEYVALDTDPSAIRDLATRVTAEAGVTWLTVPTTDPNRIAGLLEAAGLVLLKRSEQMMATDLRQHAAPPPPPGYTVDTRVDAAVVSVTVLDPSGNPGAHGTMGLTGTDAVADRIETLPDHRRRGLGSTVMGALAAAARSEGATHGILIASEEGQLLYTRLGWHPVADVLIAAPSS